MLCMCICRQAAIEEVRCEKEGGRIELRSRAAAREEAGLGRHKHM